MDTRTFFLPVRALGKCGGFDSDIIAAMRWAAGLAVVATRVGGNPLLVADETTGLLVPPAQPAELAKAILRLIEAPALATALGARARQRVRDEFGVDRMLARVQALYDRLLAEVGS